MKNHVVVPQNEHIDSERVLFVITKSNWGGAQHYVYNMAVGAKKAGINVSVATGGSGPLVEKLLGSGIPIFQIDTLGRDVNISRDMHSFFRLLQIIREYHPDVLHLNSSKIGVLGGIAGRLCGVRKIVFTAHGWAFNEARPKWQKIIIRILAYVTVALSHQTIAVSNMMRRDAQYMLGVRNKIIVIQNGVDIPELITRTKAREALLPQQTNTEDQLWIGSIAELHPSKCIDVAIDAFAMLENKQQLKLVIIGEGEMRSELEKRIEKHDLQNHIFLVGYKHAAARLLKTFDTFILPSHTEALGMVILEAGLAKLPVVATRVGGIPEIVEDGVTGLLVEPKNPEDLAKKMTKLLNDPKLRTELAENLHKKVTEQFSLEKMVHNTIKIYTS